jgi:chromosome segregation ATPase
MSTVKSVASSSVTGQSPQARMIESSPYSINMPRITLGQIPPFHHNTETERGQLGWYRNQLNCAAAQVMEAHRFLLVKKKEVVMNMDDYNKHRADLDARIKAYDGVKVELDARAKELDQRKEKLDARSKENDQRKAALNGRAMALNCKQAELDGRDKASNLKHEKLKRKEVEHDALEAQFFRRSTDLHEKEAELSNINAGMLIRGLEQESIKTQQDARKDGLDERETDLDRREDEVETRWSAVIRREAELDKREAQITERQATLLRALNAESDKNHAALETKRAELDARAAELDTRAAELGSGGLEKVKIEHADDGVVVAEEVPSGRKRLREVDFSQVEQATEQLKRIYGGELDDQTKQELKQLVLNMLRVD